MPRLPILSAREVLRALGKAGFEVVGQRGSHLKLRGVRAGRERTVIVPNYDEVPRGVLLSILRQAGMGREEFASLL